MEESLLRTVMWDWEELPETWFVITHDNDQTPDAPVEIAHFRGVEAANWDRD